MPYDVVIPLPTSKGIYVLILDVLKHIEVNLRSRRISLEPGIYCYVGSALGPGGLHARVKHHLNKDKGRLWWHIDYLTSINDVVITYVVYAVIEANLEELVALNFMKSNCWLPAAKGFGSSDRRSYTHLFKCLCGREVCLNEACEVVNTSVGGCNIVGLNPIHQ